MKQAMIVANPSSGKEQAEQYIDQLKNALSGRFGEITVRITKEEGDAFRFASESAAEQYDALFLMGGDGTVNEGINGIAEHSRRPCVGVIPLGTVNNFARSLNISIQPEEAIVQMKTAAQKKIDIGKVNDLYFISSVSAGVIPESVQNVDSDSKTTLGPLAYLFEGLKVLNDDRTSLFEMSKEDKLLKERFSLILISLGNSVTGIKTFFPDAEMNDGRVHFMGLRETSALEKLSLVPEFFQVGGEYSEQLVLDEFQKAAFRTKDDEKKEPLVCTVDGERGPAFPIKIEVLPGYLSVFSPDE